MCSRMTCKLSGKKSYRSKKADDGMKVASTSIWVKQRRREPTEENTASLSAFPLLHSAS